MHLKNGGIFMKWHSIFKIHKTISAVGTEDGVLKSLLFSLDNRKKRTNEKKGNKLYFFFPSSHRKNDIEALKEAIKTKKVIPVYYKIAPDNWENLGEHIVEKCFNGNDSFGRESIVFVVSPIA